MVTMFVIIAELAMILPTLDLSEKGNSFFGGTFNRNFSSSTQQSGNSWK
jgi:hypothetical protein